MATDKKRLEYLLMHLPFSIFVDFGLAENSDILLDHPDDIERTIIQRIDVKIEASNSIKESEA